MRRQDNRKLFGSSRSGPKIVACVKRVFMEVREEDTKTIGIGPDFAKRDIAEMKPGGLTR